MTRMDAKSAAAAAYLEDANERTNAIGNSKQFLFGGDIGSNREVGLLSFHELEKSTSTSVGVSSSTFTVCLEGVHSRKSRKRVKKEKSVSEPNLGCQDTTADRMSRPATALLWSYMQCCQSHTSRDINTHEIKIA